MRLAELSEINRTVQMLFLYSGTSRKTRVISDHWQTMRGIPIAGAFDISMANGNEDSVISIGTPLDNSVLVGSYNELEQHLKPVRYTTLASYENSVSMMIDGEFPGGVSALAGLLEHVVYKKLFEFACAAVIKNLSDKAVSLDIYVPCSIYDISGIINDKFVSSDNKHIITSNRNVSLVNDIYGTELNAVHRTSILATEAGTGIDNLLQDASIAVAVPCNTGAHDSIAGHIYMLIDPESVTTAYIDYNRCVNITMKVYLGAIIDPFKIIFLDHKGKFKGHRLITEGSGDKSGGAAKKIGRKVLI